MSTSYKVEYRLPGSTFKKTIKGCVEDGLVEHGRSRYFVTDDNCRVEVPIHSEFYFGADRYEFIDRLKKKLDKIANIPAIYRYRLMLSSPLFLIAIISVFQYSICDFFKTFCYYFR